MFEIAFFPMQECVLLFFFSFSEGNPAISTLEQVETLLVSEDEANDDSKQTLILTCTPPN
jgi:hypothetical protein